MKMNCRPNGYFNEVKSTDLIKAKVLSFKWKEKNREWLLKCLYLL